MSHKRKPKQSPKKRVTPPEPEQITTVDELIEYSNKTGHSYGLFDNEGGWNIWQKGTHFYVAALNRDKVGRRKVFDSEQAAVNYIRSKSKG